MTDRKVDEDMKRLRNNGVENGVNLYEEEIAVRGRGRKLSVTAGNRGTTL